MARGDVYLHSAFPFHDGASGKKLFVVLNDPVNDEPYLVIKTTSNLRGKSFETGCNPRSRVFFIQGKAGSVFPIDTLLQLSDIYEFSGTEFLKGHMVEKVIEHKTTLHHETVAQIINCVKKLKEDISIKHFTLITHKTV